MKELDENIITIIIPHKNNLHGLYNLLNSISEENSENIFQIIVVDDGSDDYNEVQKLVDGIANCLLINNVSAIKNAGSARNLGLMYAEGKWILFADSDDLFITGFSKVIKKYIKANTDIIYFLPNTLDIKSLLDYRHQYSNYIKSYYQNKTEENKWIIRLNFDVPWSKMISHQFVKENNICFDETNKNNDTLFSQKAGILANSVLVSSNTIYKVNDNKKSISYNISDENLIDYANVMVESIKLKKKYSKVYHYKLNKLELSGIPLKVIMTSFVKTRNLDLLKKQYKIFYDKGISSISPFNIAGLFYIGVNKFKSSLSIYRSTK